MSPASRSARRAASQCGVGVAEDAGEVRGEVVQVFAGVVEVHDGGGLGQDRGGQVPDPGRAVAQDDELADVHRRRGGGPRRATRVANSAAGAKLAR